MPETHRSSILIARRCCLRWSPLLPVGLIACWTVDRAPVDTEPQPWRPIAEAPSGWELQTVESPFPCPDGEPAAVLLVQPRSPESIRAVALLLHDGAFDYRTSEDTDSLTSARDPSRLTAAWGARRAAATLGTWRPEDAAADYTGALPIALAERGITSVVPTGCWGDLGAGAGATSPPERFPRSGAELNRWAWRLLTQGEVPDAGLLGPVADTAYLVAIGSSGRGAGALLSDPELRAPDGLFIDSVPDDLGPYYDDPAAWGDRLIGLDRIWPAGRSEAARTSIARAPLPQPTALFYSSEDPTVPSGTIDALAQAVTSAGGDVLDTTQVRHLQTAGDSLLAERAVRAMLGEPLDEPDTDTDDG